MLTRPLHDLFCLWDRGVYPRIIFAVEPIDRAGNALRIRRVFGPRAIEDVGRLEFRIVVGITKGLSAAQQNPVTAKEPLPAGNLAAYSAAASRSAKTCAAGSAEMALFAAP